MKTYICFNDESGSWNDERTNFYIRASLLVDTTQLKDIENDIISIRESLQLGNLNEEIKWQDLWRLRNCFKQNKDPSDKRLKSIYSFLKKLGGDYHQLIEYCDRVLSLLNESKYDFKIILTFTEKSKYPNHKEKDIYKFHIQDHLERIQMQCSNSIVIVVYDSIDDNKKKLFKAIHNEIITNGDFIKEYNSIYESLLFDDSYDNKLLQMMDFIAGTFAGTLTSIKKQDSNNYQKAVEFFCNYIYPKLCKDKKNEIWGSGLKETPGNNNIRENYRKKMDSIFSQRGKDEIKDDFHF
ncbi:Protein of unknown function [Thermoflavifilum thermophilum]|uniref:DUF3800 domain-containing protein n=2 Tax=Thermoflavifilum thermophilum TaxID=1393122 RepID=A0A1I7NH52_9BACT|nr:Protein of unknown function [Thermoflavifilum thermophilum]